MAHGVLRDILSRYLAISPSSIQMEADRYGKPSLAGKAAGQGLQFNLSHADNLAACAVTRSRRVGVDVEWVRPIAEIDAIAGHYFTAAEQALLDGAGADGKEAAFLTCWTRKEAYIKAVGKGLSIPLTSFDATIPPGASGRLLRSNDDAIRDWWLADLPPIPLHAGSLVVQGNAPGYAFWRWRGPALHERRILEDPCTLRVWIVRRVAARMKTVKGHIARLAVRGW